MDHSGSFLPPYLSTRTTAFSLSALLLVTAAVFSVSAGFEISEVRLLVGAMDDGAISAMDRYTHSLMRTTLATTRIGLVGTTALLFASWLYRSRINGRAFGSRFANGSCRNSGRESTATPITSRSRVKSTTSTS